ncbi:hypothetical protein [Macrococcoides caseolyticum]|uniref:hypothetical protein n=1 Tax=Macrococcoides caseolyticum TaxID=69966 RepID=UPI001F342A90|nr:hypothetical protein [Macrococcus caseolyticus]MCE4955996.1 hypothetical protein [Macrococcus caseolyticus]
MLHYYISHHKKQFIFNIIFIILITAFLIYAYFPKYMAFGFFILTMNLPLLYIDYTRTIRKQLEKDQADAKTIKRLMLKEVIAYTLLVTIGYGIGKVVVHYSPKEIPALYTFIGMLIAYTIITFMKWLRLYEYHKETRD